MSVRKTWTKWHHIFPITLRGIHWNGISATMCLRVRVSGKRWSTDEELNVESSTTKPWKLTLRSWLSYGGTRNSSPLLTINLTRLPRSSFFRMQLPLILRVCVLHPMFSIFREHVMVAACTDCGDWPCHRSCRFRWGKVQHIHWSRPSGHSKLFYYVAFFSI